MMPQASASWACPSPPKRCLGRGRLFFWPGGVCLDLDDLQASEVFLLTRASWLSPNYLHASLQCRYGLVSGFWDVPGVPTVCDRGGNTSNSQSELGQKSLAWVEKRLR